MRQTVALLFIVLFLAACAVPRAIPETQTVPPAITPTQTASSNSQNCAYVWASRSLPDITAKLQSAINAAGLKNIQATATAFGEDCFDPQTNEVVRFATMETDFYFTVPVDDLNNLEDLGSTLEKILIVLDAFPPGEVPGPKVGNISISFESGTKKSYLNFSISAGESARQQGLHGVALFEKIQKK
jgi:hypothetical protein